LDVFNGFKITFAYFLACEVGGSKYLTGSRTTSELFVSNSHLHSAVLPWLEERDIKYVYVGSQLMESQPSSPYGMMKAHGRDHCKAYAHLCRLVVFWNVYGMEPLGIRSHFLPDWLDHCLLHNGRAAALTDGTESRQMNHVDDVSKGLILLMKNFDTTPLRIDLTHGHWHQLNKLAPLLANAPKSCQVKFTHKKTAFSVMLDPNTNTTFHKEWLAMPQVPMQRGVNELQKSLEELHVQADKSWPHPYATFVFTINEEDDPSTLG
jgi:nucleoside-diphosphate-sugar epimerase